MLSYQHTYHAGCLADVQKHAALSLMLTKMVQKPKALSYIETHAGRGLYDLSSEEAKKTGEANAGIRALLRSQALPPEHPYATIVAKAMEKYGKSCYPGSAFIAKSILKKPSLVASNPMHLMELHPQEYEALKSNITGQGIYFQQRDGYAAALGLSPAKPRRGIVFIDPSFEMKEEYQSIPTFIAKLHRKWPEAVILLWYPILATKLHQTMIRSLSAMALPKYWQQEIMFGNQGDLGAMEGTGLICINTPFGIEKELADIVPMMRSLIK